MALLAGRCLQLVVEYAVELSRSSAMANFAAALKAAKIVEEEKAREQHARTQKLVVDMSVGVAEMCDLYSKFCAFEGTKDLYSLICPTQNCPRCISWATRPCAEWMVKVASLVYEIVLLFPNGKISSVKNQKTMLGTI